jgi:hypothetical protein
MNRQKRTEEILSSFDGLRRAPAPDFFYTRLLGKMQQQLPEKRAPKLVVRPVFLSACLLLTIAVNVFFLFNNNNIKQQPAKTGMQQQTGIDAFASDYHLNSTSVFE